MNFVERMSWSAKAYMEELRKQGVRCTGQHEGIEEHLRHLFPPLETEFVHRPCVVVDSEGFILLWYLPRLLTSKRAVCRSAFNQFQWLKYSYRNKSGIQ